MWPWLRPHPWPGRCWGRSAAGTGPETRHPEEDPKPDGQAPAVRQDSQHSGLWSEATRQPASPCPGEGPQPWAGLLLLSRDPCPGPGLQRAAGSDRWKVAAFEGQWPGRPSPLLRQVRNDNPKPQWAVLRALTPTPGSLQTLNDLGQTDSSPSLSLGKGLQ